MRLDKLLADASYGTRSEVKNLIKKGVVSVNGCVVKNADLKVDPAKDEIFVNGQKLKFSTGFRYYILNKPAGVITATKDDNDKTVLDLLPKEFRKNISAVGRLDKDTEGLLILTDDGEFNHRLMSPKKHVTKTYFARLSGECPGSLIEEFKRGVDIGDEKLCKPSELVITDLPNEVLLTITEGRYHQVKRMFLKYGLKVIYLKRVSIGPLSLPDDLKIGEIRTMTSEEVALFL